MTKDGSHYCRLITCPLFAAISIWLLHSATVLVLHDGLPDLVAHRSNEQLKL